MSRAVRSGLNPLVGESALRRGNRRPSASSHFRRLNPLVGESALRSGNWPSPSRRGSRRLNPLVGESALRSELREVERFGPSVVSQSPRRGIGSPELIAFQIWATHYPHVSIPSSGNRLSGVEELRALARGEQVWVSIPSSGNRLSGDNVDSDTA